MMDPRGRDPVTRVAVLCLLLALSAPAARAESQKAAENEPAAVGYGLRREKLDDERKSLLSRPDEKRPEEQLTLDLWGRPLTVGWSYEIRLELRDDAPFKDRREDDTLRMGQRLSLNLFYRLTEATSVYLKGNGLYLSRRKWFDDHPRGVDEDRERERGLELSEAWFFVRNLFDSPFSLQAGRQRISEPREWWWDEDLQAVRLHFDMSNFHFEVGLAEHLVRVSTIDDHIDSEEEDVLRFLGRATWEWTRKNRIELFFMSQNDNSGTGNACPSSIRADPFVPLFGKERGEKCREASFGVKRSREDESDANLTWLGLSARGRWKLGPVGRLRYWADTAVVDGRETFLDYSGREGARYTDSRTRHDVRGWGFDLGMTWETRLPGHPALTLGYAVGSGDVPETSQKAGDQELGDRSFRQTGLQDNNGRFTGVDRFKYYGELLRPELSNLRIATAALGFRFLRSSSVELVYHSYQQADAAKFLRDADIRRQPSGRKRGIGHEIDLVVGIEEWEHVELELIGSAFRSGPAFSGHCDNSAGGTLDVAPSRGGCDPEDIVPATDGNWSYLAFFKLKLNF